MAWLNHDVVPHALASGRLSNWFVNTDPFFDDVKVRDMIVEIWAQKILRDLAIDSNKEARIYGVETGGVRWAKALWLRLRDRALLLHDYRDKRNTYIVDDVLTTGSTIKELGTNDEPVLVVMSREWPGCRMIVSSVTAWMHIELPIGAGSHAKNT